MGAVHTLRVKSPYKLLQIEDIKITSVPNEHGVLYLKCLVDESINFEYSIVASTKDEIIVYEEKEDENNNSEVDINNVDVSKNTVLFNGVIKSIKTTNENGVYYIEINGVSKTSELDIKEKSRSFQNVNMTYDELIVSVLKDYSDKGFIQTVGCRQKINKPIFQYKETDWNFLKRICSELNSVIYSDIVDINNLFFFGIDNGIDYEINETIPYRACKDLKAFYKAGGYDAGHHDEDYFYYEIISRRMYNLGDKIYFKKKDLYVTQYEAYKDHDEVLYKYKLCIKDKAWNTKLYNSLICGASLEGKVLDVQGEEVKLHLDIDENQDKDNAAWFRYAPPTGNIMYSMPIIGTSARLYFPDETGNDPLVSGCVRNNGNSCEKTSDTTKRYLGTEHGSEIEMTPSAVNIKGGSESPISISIDDNVGITITSPKKLSLNADSELIMKTPKNIKINGVSQVSAQKTGANSGFSLETDLNFLSDNVFKNGSSNESYEDFDDDPQEGTMSASETSSDDNNSQFNMELLIGAAVAAVGVVATVATGGLMGTVMVAAAVACIGAAVCVAASNTISSPDSNMSFDDIMNMFKGAIMGAVMAILGGKSSDNEDAISEEADRFTNGHVSYIFYQPGVMAGDRKHIFDNQAEIMKRKYEEKYPGTRVVMLPVSSAEEFKEKWNNIDDSKYVIDAVEIILHGSVENGVGYMYFEYPIDDPTPEYRIAADDSICRMSCQDISIESLDNKKVNELFFSSCNSANLDVKNTTSAFENIVDTNEIVGWDGGEAFDYEKEEDVKGGEGWPTQFRCRVNDSGLVVPYATETTKQPTWWRNVDKDKYGNPVREREGKVYVKEKE